MLPYQVKADDRHHQRAEKENPPECSRLSQKEDTGQHRAYGTYSTPYGITRTYCNTIFTADRLEEHKHADGNTGEKGEEPQKSRLARCCRYLFQTKGKRASNNPPTIRNIQFVIVVMMIICKYTSTVPAPTLFVTFNK